MAGRRPGAPTELPVAGRRPEPPAAPRQTGQLPIRAEDMFIPSAGQADGGGWFSRQGPSSSSLGVTPPPAIRR